MNPTQDQLDLEAALNALLTARMNISAICDRGDAQLLPDLVGVMPALGELVTQLDNAKLDLRDRLNEATAPTP